MAETQVMKVMVETPDGALAPAEVAVCDGPVRLADLVPALHELTSGVTALAVARAAREGRTLSCKAGCGVCCCQLVPLAPAEVFYMVDRLLAMPAAERRPVLARFQNNENRLAVTGILDRISALEETDDNNRVAGDYFELHLACPFLVNQSCSIHPWRPIACREYNVTSPPRLCADPFRNPIAAIKLHRRMSAGLSRFCTQVAGLPSGLVPLPLMFDYYETHKDISARTWPGIDLFRQVMGFMLGEVKRQGDFLKFTFRYPPLRGDFQGGEYFPDTTGKGPR
jgi:Fe-S-cluster containining protein